MSREKYTTTATTEEQNCTTYRYFRTTSDSDFDVFVLNKYQLIVEIALLYRLFANNARLYFDLNWSCALDKQKPRCKTTYRNPMMELNKKAKAIGSNSGKQKR